MTKPLSLSTVLLLTFLANLVQGCTAEQNESITNKDGQTSPLNFTREQAFNHGWHFTLTTDANENFANITSKDFEHWQAVSLPHDWSIKAAFDKKYDGATAYLPGGIGWYAKAFNTEKSHEDRKVTLYFDGVYANSEVWLNGHKLGGRINGYSPFYFDLTEFLSPVGEPNIISVKVDHSRYIDSRWYTGSGIYREVKLITTNKLHVPIWGTFVTTPNVEKDKANVNFNIEVVNKHQLKKDLTLVTHIFDAEHKLVKSASNNIQLGADSQQNLTQQVEISSPNLWDIESPYLYTAKTQIYQQNTLVDEVSTPFGIRTFEFTTDKGFFLNNRSLKIKGVNLHHDAGLVGTAVPDDVWRRRLLSLKAAGTNAIRLAHNPVSTNFLKLCDELGLLVQAEIFDEWDNPKDKRLNQWERHSDEISRGYADHFQSQAERDLKDSMLRDRNHPSIIMWSIGNEIEWTYPRYKAATGYFDMNAQGNYFYNPPFISPEEIVKRFHDSKEGQYVLAKTAKKLSNWVKEIDTTRPVTANLILPSVSHISGYTDALDVVGYSYRRVIYDYGHELFPEKPIMGSENVVQWHEWQAIEQRDFIAGTFLWTGIDYLGEAHNAWPRKTTPSGMLDTAGFEKPSYHMMKSLWQEKPHIHITSQLAEKSLYQKDDNNRVVEKEPGKWQERVWFWQDVNQHWNYENGDLVIVEVLSNCPAVELFLNETSLGEVKLADSPDHIFKWAVNFEQGVLHAKGLGDCQTEQKIATASEPVSLVATIDKQQLDVDINQVAHIELQLIDDAGRPVKHTEQQIQIKVPSNLELLGVDNGNSATVDSYFSNSINTNQGQALVIVRAKDKKPATVTVKMAGKVRKTLQIN